MAQTILCLFLTSLCLHLSQAVQGDCCTDNSQCGCNECCQILSDVHILSRRQSDLLIRPTTRKTGTCQPYRTAGQTCSPFYKINGECGCAPGLECLNVGPPVLPVEEAEARRPVGETTPPAEQRLIIAGNYQCVRVFRG